MSNKKEFDDVAVEALGSVAVVRLNDPKTMNAISPRMMGGLEQALAHVDRPENGFRAFVLTGTGRGFCSGANLTTTGPDDITRQDDFGAVLKRSYYPVLKHLRALRIPSIAAVNGPAMGFGLSLALMCDLVLAAKSAFFQLTFSRIGLVPDGGAAWLLPRVVGLARAHELIVLAERLSAEKAHAWGLVNQLHDDDKLLDSAIGLAGELTKRPTRTLTLVRQAYWQGLDNSYDEQLELEAKLQSAAGKAGDFIEGVMAFREKREPKFD